MCKAFLKTLPALMLAFFVFASLPSCMHRTESGTMTEENEEYDGIEKAMLQEIEQTKDPATGRVPWEKLVEANRLARISREEAIRTHRTEILSWTERGPYTDAPGPSGNTRPNNDVTAGRVRAIMVDSSDATKKTVWVGGVDGGLWKTTDITVSPANWQLVNDQMANLAIAAICQDPRPGFFNNMYACTGESFRNIDAVRGAGVFKSTDGGITWNQLASTTSFTLCTRILCDYLGNIYLGTRGSGLQRSMDGGATWTNITPSGVNTNICDLEISSTSALGRLHMVTGIGSAQTYRYTDNPTTVSSGAGWVAPTTAFPAYNERCEMAVSGNVLYAAPCNPATYNVPTIYKSTDGGDNWTATVAQPGGGTWANGQGWYSLSVGIDPSDPNSCIVGGLDCYKTTDGGTSWTKISTWVGSTGQYVHADQHNIQWWDGGNKLMFGCDGGVHFSSDKGTTIRDRNVGLRIKQFYSVAIHPTAGSNYFLAGAQDNGVHQLNSPGLSNSIEVTGGDGMFVAIDQNEPNYQFGSYVYNQYRRSTNGGTSWSSINFSSSAGRFINPFDYDNTGNIFYACDVAGSYRRWDNPQTGATSSVIAVTSFAGQQVSSVTVSPYTANRVYFGTGSGRVVKVDNANTTPVDVNITPSGASGYTNNVAVGSDDNHLIACYSSYGVTNVWLSNDGGTTWTACDGNLPDMPVRWAIFHPDTDTKAIIATETGVWETDLLNGASTIWTADPSFPNVSTHMLRYRASDRTLAAGTHGRGVWSTVIPSVGCTAPAVTTQPVSQTVCAGANVLFTVAASGTSPFTYQWQLSTNGGGSFTDIAGATSATYGFAAAIGQNTYQYRCVVSNCAASTATSNAAVLTVNAAPAITGQPASQTVCAGSNTSFTVTATGAGIAYQWQVSTDGGVSFGAVNNGGVYTGATTATLNITGAITAMNGYQYRCVVSSATCAAGVNSAAAVLTVNTVPAVLSNPTDITICTGSNASFSIQASGTGISYQWQFSTDGGATYNPVTNGGIYSGATSNTLTLTAPTVAYNGYRFRCVVSGTCTPAAVSGAAILTVATSVAITTQPGNQTVCENAATSFTVAGSGSGIIYQWQFSTDGGATYTNVTNGGVYSGATTATLSISAVTVSMNNYRYRCQLSTSSCIVPSISTSGLLTVNTNTVITSQPQSQTTCVGGNVQYCVTATGTNLTYQWQVSVVGCTSPVWNNIVGASSNCYTVTNANVAQNGYAYQCVVSGTCGVVNTNCAGLTVISPVTIAAGGQPANAEICSGSNTSFTVTGTSTQAISYQWQLSTDNGATYSDIAGATTNTYLVISAPVVMNGYRFRCKMSNAACTTPVISTAAVLTVHLLPGVSLTALPGTSLLPGQTTLLTAGTVTTGGTLTTTWFYNSNPLVVAGNSYVADVEHLGTYQVKVQEAWVSGLVCLNQSSPIVISAEASGKLFIFPTPNDGLFKVSYYNAGGAATRRSITIYDSKGAKVYGGWFNITGLYTLIQVNARGNESGIYYVVVGDATGKKLADGKVMIH